jgi:RecJ-like exonuclease
MTRGPRNQEIPRPLCGCGNPVHYKGKTINGFKIWKSGCRSCEVKGRKQRKDYCEKCGGTENLHIDHKDGNRSNNELSNLQTLCKDCHHIKSLENDDLRRKSETMLGMYTN